MNRCILLFTILYTVRTNRIKDINNIDNHITKEGHRASLDHESFLGIQESKTYDKLLPEESKSRLRELIISKVDIDGNGFVSEGELNRWIAHISKLSREKERDDYFPIFSNSPNELLDFDTYLNRIYGGLNVDQLDKTSKANLAIMQMQDGRKWKFVDENKDDKLDKNEFLVFQHPEDYPRMKSLIIQETLEISDKNKDGHLDIDEYISDIWAPGSKPQPEEYLVLQEKETFRNHRDKNKDNKLNAEEIGDWLMPTNYDPVAAETTHLLHNADADEDRQLSLEEIMNSYEVFVGSQATDYGNALKHEEL